MARADLELEFFPFFVDRFLSATLSWPALRVGAYMRLMMYQWKHGSVPGDDVDELSRIIGEPIEVTTTLWEKLAVKFPTGAAGYQNAKLEEVREGVKRRVRGNKNRTKAATKAAADAKRKPSRAPNGDIDASVTDDVTPPSTDGNLETVNTKEQKTLPTPTPPLQGGALHGSVTDGLTEKLPTRAEKAKALAVRTEFGCPHAHPEADPPVPECETEERCVGRLVGEARIEEREGLKAAVI
jgi:uncharacterized protein YdaU (DUF1376 family)